MYVKGSMSVVTAKLRTQFNLYSNDDELTTIYYMCMMLNNLRGCPERHRYEECVEYIAEKLSSTYDSKLRARCVACFILGPCDVDVTRVSDVDILWVDGVRRSSGVKLTSTWCTDRFVYVSEEFYKEFYTEI